MKKVLFIICLLLPCIFLFAENDPNSISTPGVRLQIQEFAYPFIPSAAKLLIEVPLSLFVDDGFLSKTNTRVWYLASSPLFVPEPFFEGGLLAEYELVRKPKSTFSMGLGTAFSQQNGITSIPFIFSIRWKYFPLSWLEVQASLENYLYGEGDIIDIQFFTTFKPFDFGLLFNLGVTGAIGYSWSQNLLGYSYGLSAGLGYLF